ncbi:DUF1269 domain-containing protein [Pseudorhodobacter sp. W20_MBD10_FR17]|uniref:DUF1269 domain-containing protein n=1 Tax=Pseudorhodobacter sp. W20_MBD10_FR17 TaxID=3240266 RepID=UPI003F993902
MRSLVVAYFQTSTAANTAREALLTAPSAYLPDVADAVIVTANSYGAFRLEQFVNLWTTKRTAVPLVQIVQDTLFLQPLLGVMEPATANPLRDAFDDFGISPTFTSDMQNNLAQDSAALIVFPHSKSTAFVVDILAKFSPSLSQTPVDTLFDANLSAAFEAAHHAIRLQHGALIGA